MKTLPVVLCAALVWPLVADEGMWPFNQFPKDAVKEKRDFEVTDGFLDNLRLAAVRLAGGSGSFVSPNGLILTNQHLVAGCLSKLGSGKTDYVKDGFYASTQAQELQCPGSEASVLVKIEDVTEQVRGPVKDVAPPAKVAAKEATPPAKSTGKDAAVKAKAAAVQSKAAAAQSKAAAKAAEERIKADAKAAAEVTEQRNAAIARIEKDCIAKTGNRCSVVKLFSGGRYDLYQYKVYSDLRMVFAPEYDLAFFGRERDAITYLRYGLDVAFLRAYESGKPAATPHYLKWSQEGIKAGDLVFTAGSPDPTMRLATAAQLTFYRDTALPRVLRRLGPRITALKEFSAKSEENQRAAQPVMTLFLANFKSAAGKLIGLKDDRLVGRKTVFEGKIRRAVERDPKLGEAAGKVWDEIATAYKGWASSEKTYQVLEGAPAPGSNLFRIARQVVRNDPRMLDADAQPISDSLETLLLGEYLEELNHLSLSDKELPIKAILGKKTPQVVAETMVKSTKLKDMAERKRLAADHDALRKSEDGVVRLAALLEDAAQKVRIKHQQVIESLEASATDKIAQYRLALFGAADYPDGTSTPRVGFGIVKAYTDRAGVAAPFAASFGGLYYRQDNQGPYQVPQRWVDLKPTLDMALPLDFVSTCDIGGGDYGSPAVNRAGELVGVTFDGNLESLPNVLLYTDEQARAVHVAVQGIREALAKIYKADALLAELGR